MNVLNNLCNELYISWKYHETLFCIVLELVLYSAEIYYAYWYTLAMGMFISINLGQNLFIVLIINTSATPAPDHFMTKR